MKSKATASIILDPVAKGEKRVLKLQVIYNRIPVRKSLGGSQKITVEDFQKKNKAYKDAFEEIRPKYQKACDIIAAFGEDFTFEQFREAWKDEAWSKKKGVGKYANFLIRDLYTEYFNDSNKTFSPETKESYLILVKWIEKFKQNTRINDITVDFLNELSAFIKAKSFDSKKKETSDTSIAIYMRGLRAVFNYAIDKQFIAQEKYPFGRNKFKLTSKKSTNIALTEEEFELFSNSNPQYYKEKLGYHFFFLSYILDGLNLADIIRIKNRDITNNSLSVSRWKVRNASFDEEYHEKQLLPLALEIFKIYGEINPNEPNKYVMRFLWDVDDKDVATQDKKKKNLNKNINKGIKSLCEKIGIEPFSLYSARHTYATDFVNSNLPIAILSQNLLHKNITTTQCYVDNISTSNKLKNIEFKTNKLSNIKI